MVNYFGESQGVDPKPLTTGMHWIAPWKSVHSFPIFEQNVTWEASDGFQFQTKDGMAVNADVGITFHLDPDRVPGIFQRYRRGIDEISGLFIHNVVRDAVNTAASKVAIEDLYGAGKEDFFRTVHNAVRNELSGLGIDVTRIYLVGRFHFPERVLAALNSKIEATQRAQQRENELREAEAQAKKEIAHAEGQARCLVLQAESEAQANNLLSSSITAELIEWQAVQKWDGKLPQAISGAIPLLNLK